MAFMENLGARCSHLHTLFYYNTVTTLWRNCHPCVWLRTLRLSEVV